MNKDYMRLAIQKAREGIMKGDSPFGACIIKDDQVISVQHNTVLESTNIIAHAEINAIQETCTILNTIDLSGCELYSTTEPCPMCFAACHWARINIIYYGTSIADAKKYGFNELEISNCQLQSLGNCEIKLFNHFLRNECIQLFEMWYQQPNKRTY